MKKRKRTVIFALALLAAVLAFSFLTALSNDSAPDAVQLRQESLTRPDVKPPQYAAFQVGGVPVSHDRTIEEVIAVESALPNTSLDYQGQTRYAEAPSFVSPYKAGSLNAQDLEDALNTLKMLRYLAGLNYKDLAFTAELNSTSQHKAVFLAATNQYAHSTSSLRKPSDMPQSFFDTAQKYTGECLYGGMFNISKSILDFVADPGDNNIQAAGHRMMLFAPGRSEFGIGYAHKEGTTYTDYIAIHASDYSHMLQSDTYIAWPNAGYFPLEYFIDSEFPSYTPPYPWSLQLGAGYSYPLKDEISLILTRERDGKQWEFNSRTPELKIGNMPSASMHLAVSGKLITFRPDLTSLGPIQDGDAFTVYLAGISDSEGVPASLRYTVNFFDLAREKSRTSINITVMYQGVTVSGATVDVEGLATSTSDARGQAVMRASAGAEYKYTVSKAGFMPASGTVKARPGNEAVIVELTPTVTFVFENTEQAYDGSPKTVAVKANPEVPFIIKYNSSEEPPVDAGVYEVSTQAVSDQYTGRQTATLVISPRQLEESMLETSGSFTYTGSPQNPNFSLTDFGMPISPEDFEASQPVADGGTHEFSITGKRNYAGRITRSFTIDPAPLSEIDAILLTESAVYNAKPQPASVLIPNKANYGELAVYYSGTGSTYYDKSVEPPSNAGEYEVSISVSGGGSILPSELILSKPFLIEKARATALNQKVMVESGQQSVFTLDLNALLPSSVDPSQVTRYTASKQSDPSNILEIGDIVGSELQAFMINDAVTSSAAATVAVSFDSGNYDISDGTFTVISTDKPVVEIVGVKIASRPYDGTPISISQEPEFIRANDGSPIDWMVPRYTWSSGSPPTDAGTYTLTVSAEDADEYCVSETALEFEIFKASQEIAFPAPTITRTGEKEALAAYSSSGLDISYTSGNVSLADVKGGNLALYKVGTVTITARQPGNENYLPAPEVSQTITILPNLSKNSWLSSLDTTPGNLSPAFKPDIFNYSAAIAYNVESVDISATAESGARISGDGLKELNVGENIFNIQVDAEDGASSSTYTVKIVRFAAGSLGLIPSREYTGTEAPSVGSSPSANPTAAASPSPSPAAVDEAPEASAPAVPSPAQEPAPTDTPVPAALIQPSSGRNAIISSAVTSDIIKKALAADASPKINLSGASNEAAFNSADLNASKDKNVEIAVSKDAFTFIMTPQTIGELSLNGSENVSVSLIPAEKAADESVSSRLASFSAKNAELLALNYNVGISVNSSGLEKDIPFKASLDLSDMSFSVAERQFMTGALFDNQMKSIKLLGGKVSDDWKSFTYSSSSLGPIGAVISGDLIKLHFSIGTVDYDKNGIPFRNDVAPYISESRTLVPIRAIAEALGATVSWVDSTKTVYMTKDGKTIHLSVGEELPNGLGGAVINSKRTFVPLRYVAEQLGANVVWNSENYTVDIYQ